MLLNVRTHTRISVTFDTIYDQDDGSVVVNIIRGGEVSIIYIILVTLFFKYRKREVYVTNFKA